jgi:hypothetical protein
VSVVPRVVEAKPPVSSSVEDVVLTAEGYAKLKEEHAHPTTVVRPGAADRLMQRLVSKIPAGASPHPSGEDGRNSRDAPGTSSGAATLSSLRTPAQTW